MYPIREVAKKTGVSTYTLRYYEKLGLLPPPERSDGGIRTYSETDVQFLTGTKVTMAQLIGALLVILGVLTATGILRLKRKRVASVSA